MKEYQGNVYKKMRKKGGEKNGFAN